MKYIDPVLATDFYEQITTEVGGAVFDKICRGNVRVHPHPYSNNELIELRQQINKDILKRELSHIKLKDNGLTKIVNEFSNNHEKLINVVGDVASAYLHPLGNHF